MCDLLSQRILKCFMCFPLHSQPSRPFPLRPSPPSFLRVPRSSPPCLFAFASFSFFSSAFFSAVSSAFPSVFSAVSCGVGSFSSFCSAFFSVPYPLRFPRYPAPFPLRSIPSLSSHLRSPPPSPLHFYRYPPAVSSAFASFSVFASPFVCAFSSAFLSVSFLCSSTFASLSSFFSVFFSASSSMFPSVFSAFFSALPLCSSLCVVAQKPTPSCICVTSMHVYISPTLKSFTRRFQIYFEPYNMPSVFVFFRVQASV